MTISDEVVEAALKAFNLKWDELHNHLGGWALGGSSEATQSMRAATEAAVRAERECCAKIAEATKSFDDGVQQSAGCLTTGERIAAVIRNRKSGARE